MSSDAFGIELEEWLFQDLESLDGRALTGRLARLEQLTTKVRAAALATLGEFDDRGLHLLEFAPTAKAWLSAQVGISARTAAGSANLAKALRRMPLVAAAFAAGQITEDHARLLVRCTRPRTYAAFCRDEALLVEHGEKLAAADLDTVVQRWLLANDPDGNEPRDPDEDEVSFSRVGDRFKLNGDFGIERGLELDAALREKTDALFRRDRHRANTDPFDPSLIVHRPSAAPKPSPSWSASARPHPPTPDGASRWWSSTPPRTPTATSSTPPPTAPSCP